MNNDEIYKKIYPLLNNFEVLSEHSESYNCIAYTIGEYDKNYWCEGERASWIGEKVHTIDSFIKFYNSFGYKKMEYLDFSYNSKYEKIAIFSKDGKPTHASKQFNGDWWISKIGWLGLIKHDLFEIECDSYGEVDIIMFKEIKKFENILTFDEYNSIFG